MTKLFIHPKYPEYYQDQGVLIGWKQIPLVTGIPYHIVKYYVNRYKKIWKIKQGHNCYLSVRNVKGLIRLYPQYLNGTISEVEKKLDKYKP